MMLRFAVRSLLKTPIVTTVAVLSIALGIGANVAIFSVFNQILMRPLPVHEPDRLVNLVAPGPRSGSVSCGSAGTCDSIFSYLMFRDLARVQTSFTGIAAHLAVGLSRVAESLLFRMTARDPMVFAGATVVLIAVALCAGLIPAQRASRVDPMTALRYE